SIVEPNDVPLDVRHLVRALEAIRLTDRVWSGEPSPQRSAGACLAMAAMVMGGAEAMLERPAVFCNINVNSPLHYDVRMLEGLFAYADAGPAVTVTPLLVVGGMW